MGVVKNPKKGLKVTLLAGITKYHDFSDRDDSGDRDTRDCIVRSVRVENILRTYLLRDALLKSPSPLYTRGRCSQRVLVHCCTTYYMLYQHGPHSVSKRVTASSQTSRRVRTGEMLFWRVPGSLWGPQVPREYSYHVLLESTYVLIFPYEPYGRVYGECVYQHTTIIPPHAHDHHPQGPKGPQEDPMRVM